MTGQNLFLDTIHRLDQLHQQPLLPAKSVGLERVNTLLRELGNPHHAFRSVHIAGSSGKGSTTTMVAAILGAAGFVTGCFRSPHLVSYTERINVQSKDLPPDEWVAGFEELWPLVRRMESNRLPAYDLGRPSHGEVLFALMALSFQRRGVQWAAIEAGLGGRLDATNALKPDVAVVTNISLEHTQLLGDTVAEIATEKAAIIKPGSAAVTAAHHPDALSVIEATAKSHGVPLLRVGHEVRFRVTQSDLSGQVVQLKGSHESLSISLPLAGPFQAQNAATAFAVTEALNQRDVELSAATVRRGFGSVRLPGRLEVLQCQPPVVLDGAHNPAAAEALARSLDELLPAMPVTLIFAAMADKDVATMARALGPRCRLVLVTQVPDSPRSADPNTVAAAFRLHCDDVRVVRSPQEAISSGRSAQEPDTLLLVAGSLYLVGWARHHWRDTSPDLPPAF